LETEKKSTLPENEKLIAAELKFSSICSRAVYFYVYTLIHSYWR